MSSEKSADARFCDNPQSVTLWSFALFRAALDRMLRDPARYDSPAFGQLPEAQRIELNLRQAELHLGFLHPE